jgi:3-dehydroquinate synthase
VDSAIGGKTGINTPAGKNQIGTFHQPRLILIDPSCLTTLPERQLRAGYAEIVKYGLIGDADLFAWLETNGASVLSGNVVAHRRQAIETCVRAKAAFVVADECETLGKRALLNLGHSFAHALEAENGFSDALLHGEAVAIGLALAFRFSAERGLCPPEDAERVERHLRAAGLPIRPADMALDVKGSAIAAHMLADKKASGGDLTLILARGIGQAFVESGVKFGEVADFLDRIGARPRIRIAAACARAG